MDLNAIRNFVSRLSFIYERSRNSNGYNLEISVEDVGIGKQIITGTVDMMIDTDESEVIRFTSMLVQTKEVLKFESSYRIVNVKINEDERLVTAESDEFWTEDMFLIVNDIEKSNMFDPIFVPGNKLLIHKEGDAIVHVYRVGKNYSFKNGISEGFTLLNMNDTGVAEQVNRISKRG